MYVNLFWQNFWFWKIFLGKKGEQNEYMEFKIGDRGDSLDLEKLQIVVKKREREKVVKRKRYRNQMK